VIAVPRTLVAPIPADVSFEAAPYATVGAIALHGIRRADARVGERVGVVAAGAPPTDETSRGSSSASSPTRTASDWTP
jgi:hypothetical protein